MSEQTVTIKICDIAECDSPADQGYHGEVPCPVCGKDYCGKHGVAIYTGEDHMPGFCIGCLWERLPELKAAWEAEVKLEEDRRRVFA